jgi:hypothetical protein
VIEEDNEAAIAAADLVKQYQGEAASLIDTASTKLDEIEAIKDDIVTESENAGANELAAEGARDSADESLTSAENAGGDTTTLEAALENAQNQAETAGL